MTALRYACSCGARLICTDLPHRNDWQLECFIAEHRAEDGCRPITFEDEPMTQKVSSEDAYG